MDVLVPAITIGFIYALVALSMNVTVATTGIINFAQGELVVLGALVGHTLRVTLGLPYAIVFLGVAAVMIPAGLIMSQLIMVPVRLSGNPFAWVIATMAAVIVFSNLMALPYGRQIRVVPPISEEEVIRFGATPVRWQTVTIVLAAIGLMVVYRQFILRTRYGKAIRAVAFSPDVAELMGIDSRRVIALSYTVSAIIAGMAGLLVAPVFFISTQTGLTFTLKGLVAVVVGGIGSSSGAVLGGLMVGILDTIVRNYMPGGFGDLTVLGLLVVVLLVRPSGLLGRPAGVRG